jgi:hypothetical protein
MAISKPAGRIGATPDDTPAKEKKDRTGSEYQSGVQVGFGITGKSGMDEIPVAASKPVIEGVEGVPNLEMGERSAN